MNIQDFPSWAKRLPWELIFDAAHEFKIDGLLIAAIIQTESSGITYKVRYEPTFAYLEAPERWAKRLNLSKDTEICCQKMSWGLCQLMGGTARGLGFDGYLTELITPEVGVYWGVKYLAQKLEKYSSQKAAVAAYNAGSLKITPDGKIANQKYVDAVMEYYSQII